MCTCGHQATAHLDEPGFGRTVCHPPCRCVRFTAVFSPRGQQILAERHRLPHRPRRAVQLELPFP